MPAQPAGRAVGFLNKISQEANEQRLISTKGKSKTTCLIGMIYTWVNPDQK
jgi:hypothetical protein